MRFEGRVNNRHQSSDKDSGQNAHMYRTCIWLKCVVQDDTTGSTEHLDMKKHCMYVRRHPLTIGGASSLPGVFLHSWNVHLATYTGIAETRWRNGDGGREEGVHGEEEEGRGMNGKLQSRGRGQEWE